MTPLPTQALVAIATITATLITSLIGLVNLTLNKEVKVSEMRRDWIELLRNELADYFQSMRHLGRAEDEFATSETESKAFKRQKVEDAIVTANASYYRIRLRLNSTKPLQKALMDCLDAIERSYADWPSDKVGCADLIIRDIDAAVVAARNLIAHEWQRVKRGEQPYLRVKGWLIPGSLIIVAAFLFVVLGFDWVGAETLEASKSNSCQQQNGSDLEGKSDRAVAFCINNHDGFAVRSDDVSQKPAQVTK